VSANATAALATIGRANLALCEHWIRASIWTFEHMHQLAHAALVAFAQRPLAATNAITVHAGIAATRDAGELKSAGGSARHAEVWELLSDGLPCLVAEYARDMDSLADTR
jgi:hypothetical protein